MWSSRFLECSLLKAVGIDRLSLMDVRSLSLFSLSQQKRQLTAAQSKHSGFIITSSLVPQTDWEPCFSGACPHVGRGSCYNQNLDAISFVMLAHSRLGVRSCFVKKQWFCITALDVLNLVDKFVARGESCSPSNTRGRGVTSTTHTNT